MKDLLVVEKSEVINERVTLNTPLRDLTLGDLKLTFTEIAQLNFFIITDTPNDEYLMMKSRFNFREHNKIFKGISTLQKRVDYYNESLEKYKNE